MVEDVLRVDRHVALSGVEAAVASELCGDVDGELVGDELGEVEPSEVVGCRPKEGPVAVAQSGPGGCLGEVLADGAVAEDVAGSGTEVVLEEEGQERAELSLGPIEPAQ